MDDRFDAEVNVDALSVLACNDPWTYAGGMNMDNIEKKANSSVTQACGSSISGSCGN